MCRSGRTAVLVTALSAIFGLSSNLRGQDSVEGLTMEQRADRATRYILDALTDEGLLQYRTTFELLGNDDYEVINDSEIGQPFFNRHGKRGCHGSFNLQKKTRIHHRYRYNNPRADVEYIHFETKTFGWHFDDVTGLESGLNRGGLYYVQLRGPMTSTGDTTFRKISWGRDYRGGREPMWGTTFEEEKGGHDDVILYFNDSETRDNVGEALKFLLQYCEGKKSKMEF